MSARLRLTLSYAGFLLLAGIALMALVFYILRFVPEDTLQLVPSESGLENPGAFVPDRDDLLAALWPRALQLLAVLAVIGLAGGWFLAGRMLRPLKRINQVTRRIVAGSLDQRVKLGGRKDEFRELADTLDGMLDRLQGAFDEQRRFAANAAHELRTPFSIERSMLDVALADPAGVEVERLIQRLDETNRRGIEVVEALLGLAAIDAGRTFEREPVDIAETVAAVVAELRPLADRANVVISSTLGEGDIDANGPLVRQLASNLILNGIRHNLDSRGMIAVHTESLPDGSVQLVVTNSGPYVSPELLNRMAEPFVRGAGRVGTRASEHGGGVVGSGLGLAIVERVANVHNAALQIVAPDSGGLVVTVRFPGPIPGDPLIGQ